MLLALALLPACLPELPDDPKEDTSSDTAGAPPVVSNVRLEPADPRTNDVLRVAYDAEDPDSDTLYTAIAWTVNGVVVEGQTGEEFDGAAWFDRDDVVGVTVSVNDGSLAGEGSAQVTVENSAPSALEVVITPAEPTDDDALVCSVVTESVDPDGDAVTYAYAWTVDGVDAGVSVAEVPSDRTAAGDTWTCSVMASDGVGGSVLVSDSRTVRSSVDPEDGLVVYLPLDGSVQDDGPSAFTVSANAISYTMDRLGRAASAASLVAASWVQVASVMSIGSTTPVTMMGWVYYDAPTAAYPQAIAINGSSCGRSGMAISDNMETDEQYGMFGVSCVYSSDVGRVAVRDEWHHWAVAYSGSQTEVFVDGVSLGFEPYTGAVVGATPLTLVLGGGSVVGNHGWFVGALDEVRVYDRALTGEEVSYIMNL